MMCALPVALAKPEVAEQQLQMLQQRLSVASFQLLSDRLGQLQSMSRELDPVLVDCGARRRST